LRVAAAIPPVVLAARDAQGNDISDVVVSIDGKPPAPIGVLALELDPGTHTFVFQRSSGGATVERQVLLRQGEKNREVVASWPGSSVPGSSTPAPPATAPNPADETTDRPVPAAAWILGGVAVAGIATSAVFGALGLSARASNHCDNGCSQTQYDDMMTKFRVSDVSLAVGLVSLGAAAWVYLARPTVQRPSAGWLDVYALPGGGGVSVQQSF
jgi:hypothetical protein